MDNDQILRLQNTIVSLQAEIFRLKSVIEHLPGSIYWKDKEGVYLGRNTFSVEKMHSMELESNSTKDDVIGSTDYDLFPKETADRYREQDLLVMETKKELSAEESVTLPSGRTIIQLSTKRPINDQNGSVIGIVGNTVDITHLKNIENDLRKAKEHADVFNKTALQVAHDIRSPLATISMLTEINKSMPEEERLILREAMRRIHDIADGLLSQHREERRSGDEEKIERILVSTAILNVLSEKRLQYQRSQIQFNFMCDASDYFVCIDTNAVNFKRMISNMINNSVEALKNVSGIITISLKKDASHVFIIIADTGVGMTGEQVQRLLSHQPVATSKSHGHGIGLTHAKETLKKSQADFMIESQLNRGTTITLKFPLQNMAKYITSEIQIQPNSIVVILDDDPSIHGAWDHFFSHIRKEYSGIELHHFTNGHDCIDYINMHHQKNILLLTDYELLDQHINGLDVIEQVDNVKAILVTSHYEEKEIIVRALSKNIKILPKILSSYVKISII